eukprot:TRINITY_DN27720_c0_g1_i1.p1 TRINITY_DN27720_c0_g1~~TRINITY_DN27720_c0_g1_i1.p1  ORF type:complete len:468 (+),score=57.88 TRINITY_DN27720_c0_g1_i1:116-1519(+)
MPLADYVTCADHWERAREVSIHVRGRWPQYGTETIPLRHLLGGPVVLGAASDITVPGRALAAELVTLLHDKHSEEEASCECIAVVAFEIDESEDSKAGTTLWSHYDSINLAAPVSKLISWSIRWVWARPTDRFPVRLAISQPEPDSTLASLGITYQSQVVLEQGVLPGATTPAALRRILQQTFQWDITWQSVKLMKPHRMNPRRASLDFEPTPADGLGPVGLLHMRRTTQSLPAAGWAPGRSGPFQCVAPQPNDTIGDLYQPLWRSLEPVDVEVTPPPELADTLGRFHGHVTAVLLSGALATLHSAPDVLAPFHHVHGHGSGSAVSMPPIGTNQRRNSFRRLKQLPSHMPVRESDAELAQEVCSICLGEYVTHAKFLAESITGNGKAMEELSFRPFLVLKTRCNHLFHADCMWELVSKRGDMRITCPLCMHPQAYPGLPVFVLRDIEVVPALRAVKQTPVDSAVPVM